MAQEEKKFLDRESLKQAFTLIKDYVKGNYVSKADYQSGNATDIADVKSELNANIATAKTGVEAELAEAKAALEAADTALQTNINKVEVDYKAADDALSTRIDNLTTALQTNKIKFKIVEELPSVDEADDRTIYLIKNEEASREADDKNVYIEYMFIDGKFEEMGDTQISLADYSTTAQVEEKDAAVKAEALDTIATTKSDLQAEVASVKEEAMQAVTDLQTTVEDNNYIKAENFISSAELQALFAETPLIVDADGNVSEVDDINTALTTATAGTTIVLGQNVTVSAGTEIADGVTIDLNGFTMEVA